VDVMLNKDRKPAMGSNATPSAGATGGLSGCMAGEEDAPDLKRLKQLPSESVLVLGMVFFSGTAVLSCQQIEV